MNLSNFLAPLRELAIAAGDAILAEYRAPRLERLAGDEFSPVTAADLAANRVIMQGLQALTPDIPVLSEESKRSHDALRDAEWVWVVDPLDGTKEYLARNGEFTVNIALLNRDQSVLGVVMAPVTGAVWIGGPGLGSQRWDAGRESTPLVAPRLSARTVRMVSSRSHLKPRDALWHQAVADIFGRADFLHVGSSLKLCMLADGEADLYPRVGPTMCWDIAAAQAVLEGAGGAIWLQDGSPLRYPLGRTFVNPGFLAVGDPQDRRVQDLRAAFPA